jgi:hypothetical protein
LSTSVLCRARNQTPQKHNMEIAHATCLKATGVPGKGLLWCGAEGKDFAWHYVMEASEIASHVVANCLSLLTTYSILLLSQYSITPRFVRFAWRDSLLDSRSNIACHLAAYSCLSVDHAWLSRSGRYNTNHSDDLTRCSASPPSHVAFCIPIQISMADWRAWRSFPKAPSGFRMI